MSQPNHAADTDRKLLTHLGFTAWNDMQEAATAAIGTSPDVLLLAPTGTGKTLGFLRGVYRLLRPEVTGVQCLVLVPSRELALQIEGVWKKMSTGFKVVSSYGGHDMETEIRSLGTPPALLIGTPGRIADHLNRGTFSTDTVRILVLDEYDKSLELGFATDMSAITGKLSRLQHRVLASATDAPGIPDFVGVQDPLVVDFIRHPHDRLELQVVRSAQKDKIDTLVLLLSYLKSASALIFCNHREAVDRTSQLLTERGIDNAAFHGGLEQMEREQTLARFRNGSVRYLVATDLAARGLDIPLVGHIIHYHLPAGREEFIHRNGRTARMDAAGTAWLLLHESEALPPYIGVAPEPLTLPERLPLPRPTDWVTLFINGGKKDKLNKVDVVGFFSKVGGLQKDELGMIEVKDRVTFAAVKRSCVAALLRRVAAEKMKGVRYRIAVAR